MMSDENKRHKGEDYGAYCARLSDMSYRASEAVSIHEKWKRRLMMGSGVREADCKQRVLVVLRELLKSDFLLNDYIDTGVPKEDRKQAVKELKALGFEELLETEGADWKYALLSQQLCKAGEKRVLVDDKKAGFYIDEMQEKLSDEALETFFWFSTLTRLAYQEMDTLTANAPEEDLENQAALTPEQQAVKSFVGKIIQLANSSYDRWNGKTLVPAVHRPEVQIIIKRDELKQYLQEREKNDFAGLLKWCYPETAKSNAQLCQYVCHLQKRGYFGSLPNKLLAEVLAPIMKLTVGTVTNYLSQS